MKTDPVLRPHFRSSTADTAKSEHFRWAARGFIALCCLASFCRFGLAQPVVYVGTNAATGLGQLRAINSDGTGDRAVPVALPEAYFPSFSKDGRFLALTSQTPGRTNQISQNVFLLNLLTAQVSQITLFEDQVSATNFTYVSPWYHSLSPNSTNIAVWALISNRDGNTPHLVIYRVADGFPLAQVAINRVRTGLTQGGDGVDWHATQNILVYTVDIDTPTSGSSQPSEGAALFVSPPVDGGSASARQLTFPEGSETNISGRTIFTTESDYAPSFSPDGQQVAYVRAVAITDTGALFPYRHPSILFLNIVNLDGSNFRQVKQFNQGIYVTHVTWSRDGTQLVFDAGQQYVTNGTPLNVVDPATDALYIINTNGTGLHSLRAATAGFPVWSPTGTTFCNLPGVVVPGGVAGSASIDDCGPPLILSAGRTQSGQFRVDITGGTDNLLYRVLASPDLTGWQSIGTTPRLGTTTSFTDTNGSNLQRRFYRIVLGNN